MTQYTHPSLPGIHGNNAFTLNGVQYPRVWWRTVSPQKIEGMGFVKYDPPEPEPPTPEELQRTADFEARAVAEVTLREFTTVRLIEDEAVPVETKQALVPMFKRWEADEAVSIGDMRRHEDGLYRAIQAHTTQAGWEPPTVPALWLAVFEGAPGEVAPWVQPIGSHDAYQIGDEVAHNGKVWTCTVANNTWEPGEYGWAEK